MINHPLEPWFLKSHIVFAPVFVFAIGLIVTRHIVPHIREGVDRGRRSGLAMVWMLLPMAVSGYLIQVVTAPELVAAFVVVWDDAGNCCGNPSPVVDEETGTVWLLSEERSSARP